VRYQLPPGLSAEEERAIVAALDRYFGMGRLRPSPWVLAGRVENLRAGALEVRHLSARPWREGARGRFARRGSQLARGRGDRR
jgi:hypothetical protein